jgi:hypothetical protein
MQRFVTRKFKATFSLLLLILGSFLFIYAIPAAPQHKLVPSMPVTVPDSPSLRFAVDSLYEKLNLDSMDLSRQAYAYAIRGLENLHEEGVVANDSVLTVIDFSLPSYKKRLFVIDLTSGELLFNTYFLMAEIRAPIWRKSFPIVTIVFKAVPDFILPGKLIMANMVIRFA